MVFPCTDPNDDKEVSRTLVSDLTLPWLFPQKSFVHLQVQGGAEPTDTFQMVIDNIWKQEKICETVYKYVQVCYLLPQITSLFSENYIRQMASVYINALLQACLEVAIHAPP